MPAGAGPEESSSGPERWSGTVANQGWRRHHAGMTDDKKPAAADVAKPEPAKPVPPEKPKKVEEIGGPPGPEPTRYGDWQVKGKVGDHLRATVVPNETKAPGKRR